MREGPDISIIAALIGNPASAEMLMALMGGLALTTTELAAEAGVTLATASLHLSKLKQHGLVAVEHQGRHRYVRLADADVSTAIEALCPLAARAGHMRTRPGPRDPELRYARSCYDHLAGELAVSIFEQLLDARLMARDGGGEPRITDMGRGFFATRDIDIIGLESARRPLCRACLDWSERRHHLGGALGAAIFERIEERGWIIRDAGTRIVRFGVHGERKIGDWLSAKAVRGRPEARMHDAEAMDCRR
ncbi:MAG: ArsR/SmtB family transcription factor [Hyphomicrobiales bacterium]